MPYTSVSPTAEIARIDPVTSPFTTSCTSSLITPDANAKGVGARRGMADALRGRRNRFAEGGGQVQGAGPAALDEPRHERAADDHAVREPAGLRGLFRSPDADANE